MRGIAQAGADFQLDVTTIEAGYNSSCWKGTLDEAAANRDYDIMIAGTFTMVELLKDAAQRHPDKKFITLAWVSSRLPSNWANMP